MTDTAFAHPVVENPASVAVRARIAAGVRQELADEAAAGFTLLHRYPNMMTAGIPDCYLGMSPSNREILLDALVFYGVVRRIEPGCNIRAEKRRVRFLDHLSADNRHIRRETGMGNGRKSQRSGNLQSKKFSTQDTPNLSRRRVGHQPVLNSPTPM